MREAAAIGERIGCAHRRKARKTGTRSPPSWARSRPRCCRTWRPAARSSSMPSSARCARSAQRLGLATPNIDALLGLTRLFGRVHGLYPNDWSPRHDRQAQLHRRRMGRRQQRTAENRNPSDTSDVIGEYAPADAGAGRRRASPRRRRRCRAGRRSRIQERADIARPRRQRDPRAQGRTRPSCCRARKARRCPKASAKSMRAAQIFKFFAGEALRAGRREAAVGAPGHRRRDHARAARRGRHHHAVEFSDRDSGVEDRAGAGLRQHRGVQAGRPGAGHAPGRSPKSSPRRPAGGRVQPGDGARARSSARCCVNDAARRRPSASPARWAPAARWRGAKAASRAWRSSSSRWAARIRWSCSTTPTSTTAVELRGQRRVLLDRPALHRLVAADRHRGHPRPLRRGGGRAS